MFTAFNHNTREYRAKSNVFSNLKKLFLCLLFGTAPNLSCALETEFTGFANFGITYAKSDQLEFRTSLINTAREGLTWQTDTVVGLQMNTRINNKLDFVGQVILQDRNDDAVGNMLELAFLRYQINRNWSTKFGRFSTNSYMLTDYRYVRHAQYWARTPLEMYSQTGVLGNMNGLQVNYSKDLSFGMLKLAWSHGNSYFRNDSSEGKVRTKYEDINAFSTELQANYWRFQANYISAKIVDIEFRGVDEIATLEQSVPPAFVPIVSSVKQSLVPEGSLVEYANLGAHYQGDNIEFISEIANYNSEWALAQSARTAYASMAYSLGDFTPFVIVSTALRDEFPEIVDYSQLQMTLPPAMFQQVVLLTAEANEALRGASIDQDSLSIGFRWDMNIDWALKLQFDHNRISNTGSGLFTVVGDLPAPSEELAYNVVNLSFSTIF